MRAVRFGLIALATLIAGPVLAGPKPPIPAAMPYNWTGVYVGANAGAGWGQSCFNITLGLGDMGCQDLSGLLGGGQIGGNWQIGDVVLGAEFAADFSSISGSDTPAIATQATNKTQMPAVYMATARVGYAWDRFLVYGKGGVAWVRDNLDRVCNGVGNSGACFPVGKTANTASETRTAFLIGGGVEYGLLADLSLALEYAYLGLGTHDTTFYAGGPGYNCGSGAGQPCPASIKQNLSVITARLNWRFWGP